MADRDLTDVQVSLVIDFLKRWGIDSPELVFELTDHYCEKAKDLMQHGWSFEKVLDSWKTKKHFRELKTLQSDFEQISKKKWWKAHLMAVKKLFLTRQFFAFFGVIVLMLLSYSFGGRAVFSIAALLCAVIVFCGSAYVYYFNGFGWFFQTRDITVPFMGSWFIVMEFISRGGYREIHTGEPFELSMTALTVSITCGFVGYNLLSTAHREFKIITSEYISEPNKYQVR